MIDGLIIKKYWLDLIISGKKSWEIRGSNTKRRGQIALIESGSGQVVGVCEVVESKPLSLDDMKNNIDKHRIDCVDTYWSIHYKKPHAWVLNNAKRITPVKYKHPLGAVIWVKNVLETNKGE